MNYIFSQHALEQMEARGISKEVVENILSKPDQINELEDLTVFQGIDKVGKTAYLIRVFMNKRKSPNVIVTLYKTSKIHKYYEGKI
ncbi:MAG: DUF4258 domain-containing protein [Bacteroidota bacterium]